MKLGDMTFKQVAEYCISHECRTCPFYTSATFYISSIEDCKLYRFPSHYDLNMEVNTDNENETR